MKKVAFISSISLIFLSLCSFVGWSFQFVSFQNPYVYVLSGLAICILSGILLFLLRKKGIIPYILFNVVNAFALGLCIRGWYIFRGFNNPLWLMLLISFIATLYLWVFYVFLLIPFLNKNYPLFTLIFMLLSIMLYGLLVLFTKTTYLSTYGWYMIIEIAFVFALSKENHDVQEVYKNAVMSTYSVIFVSILMLLMMLGGDGFDLPMGGNSDVTLSSPKEKINKNK